MKEGEWREPRKDRGVWCSGGGGGDVEEALLRGKLKAQQVQRNTACPSVAQKKKILRFRYC